MLYGFMVVRGWGVLVWKRGLLGAYQVTECRVGKLGSEGLLEDGGVSGHSV